MNEVTNIMTVQITRIDKTDNNNAVDAAILASRIPASNQFSEEALMKLIPGMDDVKIISNQFFTREKGGSNG